jgi:hypothetical protein
VLELAFSEPLSDFSAGGGELGFVVGNEEALHLNSIDDNQDEVLEVCQLLERNYEELELTFGPCGAAELY